MPIDDVSIFMRPALPTTNSDTCSFLLGASQSQSPLSAFPNLAVLTRVGRPVKLVMIALLLSTLSFSLRGSAQVLHPCVFRCRALLPSLFIHLHVMPFYLSSVQVIQPILTSFFYAKMVSNHAWIKFGCSKAWSSCNHAAIANFWWTVQTLPMPCL